MHACKLFVIHYSAQGTESGSDICLPLLQHCSQNTSLGTSSKSRNSGQIPAGFLEEPKGAAAAVSRLSTTNCRAVPKVGLVSAFQSAIKER